MAKAFNKQSKSKKNKAKLANAKKTISLAKIELRRKMRLSRAHAFAANRESTHAISDIVAHINFPKSVKTIAAYIPIGDELDCQLIFQHLIKRGFDLCLPVVVKKDTPLTFKAYAPGGLLRQGPLRTLEPMENAKIVCPDVLLMPLLGFDRAGHRLGQGGGYYDRSLAQMRARGSVYAIGLAFEEQRVTTIPTDEFDQPLDGVITPHEYVGFTPLGRELIWSPQGRF